MTDEELAAHYEATKKQYQVPERRTIQQLVFKDMAAARDAAEKLAKDPDMLKLGKELGMKDTDIELGTFAKDKLADKKLAEAAFALEKDKVSEPIESFFPTIIKVTEIQPGETKTFEAVKEDVRKALTGERARAEIQKLYDEIEDARGGGSNVTEAAKKLNLPLKEFTIDRRASCAGRQGSRGPAGQPGDVQHRFRERCRRREQPDHDGRRLCLHRSGGDYPRAAEELRRGARTR